MIFPWNKNGGRGWTHHIEADTGRSVAVIPHCRLAVVETGDGTCRIMPIEAKDPSDGVEVKGTVQETAARISRCR